MDGLARSAIPGAAHFDRLKKNCKIKRGMLEQRLGWWW